MLSLRKGGHKEICPSCGKRTFKPYVDEFGVALAAHVGRCDRENNCRYHYPPREFYMHQRALRSNLPINRNPHLCRPQSFRPTPLPSPPSQPVSTEPTLIDTDDFKMTMKLYHLNPLARFLKYMFRQKLNEQQVLSTFSKMGVGTSAQFGGATLFWLIDNNGRIRDGKIMGYDRETGKRIKNPRPQITNVHTVLKCKYSGVFKTCYFGSHLLADDETDKPILLFESEKAAMVAALAFECEGAWYGLPMASGGSGNFNPTAANLNDPWHAIQVLKDRDVILFPDEGMYDEWLEKSQFLRGFCKNIFVATIMERKLRKFTLQCRTEKGDGFDDLVLRYLDKGLDYSELFSKCV